MRGGREPYAEVASAFEAALAAYEAIGDDARAGRMEAWRAFVAFQSGDDDAVLQWSEQALSTSSLVGTAATSRSP